MRIGNNGHGNLTIGPQNSTYCHFYTDRGSFYFDKKLYVNGYIHAYNGPQTMGSNSSTDRWQIYATSINANSTISCSRITATAPLSTTSTGAQAVTANGGYLIFISGNSIHANLNKDTQTQRNTGKGWWGPFSIYSQYSIWISHGAYGVYISSDERVKKNFKPISDTNSLDVIRNLECYYYDYIETAELDRPTTMGFKAQDVAKYIPDAVSYKKNFIPDENRILNNLQYTEHIDSSGNVKYKLTINDLSGNTNNYRYKFLVTNVLTDELTDISEPTLTSVNFKEILIYSLPNDSKSFLFDEKWKHVILYGKEVDDFHVLNKSKIWTTAYSALQQVDRIQQAEKTKLATMTRITALETENESLKTEVASLKSTLDSVLARLSALKVLINMSVYIFKTN